MKAIKIWNKNLGVNSGHTHQVAPTPQTKKKNERIKRAIIKRTKKAMCMMEDYRNTLMKEEWHTTN